jgi:hypothetical protein
MPESLWISYGQTLHLSIAFAALSQQTRGNEMITEFGSHDWRGRKLQEWLLLLLRYAVTREPSDRSAALAMADELDSLGGQWRPAAPRFFLETSEEVCSAIPTVNDWNNHRVLLKHLARIDDPRLRRAFQAAIGLQQKVDLQRPSKSKERNDRDLWKGLPTNRVATRPL